MRISTNQIYMDGMNALMTQQMRSNKLNMELATGLKVQYAEDDPIAFSQIQWLTQRVSTTEFLQKNCANVKNALNLEESVLSDCMNNIQRLREIQVRSGNGGMSQTDRQSMAVEASEILNQLLAFANTKDNNGDYMFAGAQTSTTPFSLNASGQYVYNGDSTQRFQLISGSLQIAINDPGDSVFMRIPGGNGSFTVNQASTNIGTGYASTGSVTDAAAYIPDNYTVSFALNTAGNMVVMVNGASSGNVIPPTGLPDDAPVYTPDMSLSFNGISLQLSGQPDVGDTFALAPAQNVSLFATVQDMIANLNMPFGSAAEKAATVTQNNQLLQQLDSAIINITDIIATLGSRARQVDVSENANSDLLLSSNETLRSLREANPIEVASEYNQQLVNLQAAQQSFVRIQGLSIFNYIN